MKCPGFVQLTATMYVEREEGELKLSLTGDYEPGSPEVRYMPNGDPGYPAEGDVLDNVVALDERGGVVELTDEELARAEDALREDRSDYLRLKGTTRAG